MWTTEWREVRDRPWMRTYCRALGIVYVYGALVHLWHMSGLGGSGAVPLAWQVADAVYAVLDVVVVAGLLFRRAWGVAAFVLTAGSQIVLFGLWPALFALSAADERGLGVMIAFHVVTLGVFIWIWRGRR